MKKRVRKILLLIIAASILILCGIGIKKYVEMKQEWNQKADEYQALARAEKEWILSCQAPDGLILHQPWYKEETEDQIVIPYFSNTAASALLSGTVSQADRQGAKAYLLWYFAHLNTKQTDLVNGAGTIYDHTATRHENGSITEQPRNTYDSVDAYAGTFLVFAQRYMETCEGKTLAEHKNDILNVVCAMLGTMQPNGLTVAKQEYPVQYTMDNVEVYRGILAAIQILQQIAPESSVLEELQLVRDNHYNSIEENLWDEQAGCYEVGCFTDGNLIPKETGKVFYPDSTVQIFPILYETIKAEDQRSASLYNAFCTAWNPGEMSFRKEDETDPYWCAIACAAAKMRDEETLTRFLNTYYSKINDKGRKYPLFTGDSGWIALACSEMEDYYRSRIW